MGTSFLTGESAGAIVSEPGGLPSRSTKVPVPSQLLGLLPPPPAAGWPSDFQLQRIAARLKEQYERENEAYVDLGRDGEVRTLLYPCCVLTT